MYIVKWKSVEGNPRMDIFAPATSNLLQTSYVHKADDPLEAMVEFITVLDRAGLPYAISRRE